MKFIAYSLFGTDDKYSNGLIANLRASSALFPEWRVIVFCDRRNFEVLQPIIAESSNAEITLVKETSTQLEGASWRFQASHLDSADTIIFRDTDSPLTRKERRAVDEWLSSRFHSHLMRDHPWHRSPVGAGMFGVRGPAVRLLSRLLKENFDEQRAPSFGYDQHFLNEHFYPKVKYDAMVHTNALKYLFEYALPFTADNADELFVGAYAHLSPAEQERFITARKLSPPMTLLPFSWYRKPVLDKLFKLYKFSRITYGCRWCI